MTDAALTSPSVRQTGRVTRTPALVTRTVAAVRAVPAIGTYAGIALAALGVLLLAVAWGKTAGLTNVALQVPYVLSAGFGGLGLIAVGLTVVNLAAKRADAAARAEQLGELRDLLVELRTLEDEGGRR